MTTEGLYTGAYDQLGPLANICIRRFWNAHVSNYETPLRIRAKEATIFPFSPSRGVVARPDRSEWHHRTIFAHLSLRDGGISTGYRAIFHANPWSDD